MNKLLQQHPEVRNFASDRFVMSPVVADYLNTLQKRDPAIWKALAEFRNKFEKIGSFDAETLDNLLKDAPKFTYTAEQARSLKEQANRLATTLKYPFGPGKSVPKGLRLDINKLENSEGLNNIFEEFIGQIKGLHEVKPLNLDLTQLGILPKLALQDPYLQGKVAAVYTLDVTTNPGLSVKDIMALYMVNDAIKQGKLSKGQWIVEGTSGNTGAGLAIVAASLGYKIVLTIPDKQSNEKIERLRQLGAHVIVTPTSVAADDPRSYYSVRDTMTKLTKGWRTGQYDNLANTQAHYEVTGPEIWKLSGGKVNVLIATMGTCGTISGIAKYLKEQNPELKVIGVDTVGSILYLLKEGYQITEVADWATSYLQQGFGEDIHPANFNAAVLDEMIRVSDVSGLNLARQLPALGVLPGQSSGAVYAALLEAIATDQVKPKDNVWLIFPDTGIPYRKDVYSDNWMRLKNLCSSSKNPTI